MKKENIRFTKHASEKFDLLRRFGFSVTGAYVKDAISQQPRVDLRRFGFSVTEAHVKDAISQPARADRRNNLTLAIKLLNDEYGLRVVYRRTNDIIDVVTFYPVRRERFNV
jgi:hypothetical protein